MKSARRAAAAFSLASIICLSTSPTPLAAKPPGGGGGSGTPVDVQVAYRLPDGKGTKLVVSNENGANQMVLYRSPRSFSFDMAPRGRQQIAIVDNSMLSLLNYSVNGSGVYVPGTIDPIGPVGSGYVDFSPDGTKIAFDCCSDGQPRQLIVRDLTTGEDTVWAEGEYYADIAWFRGGTSIVYVTTIPSAIHEVSSPMAAPQLLYSVAQGYLNVDSARTAANQNRLVISHNDSGTGRIGLWEAGSFVNPDLANSNKSWQGTLNCDDTKLAFMGVQNTSGSQAFYVRDLNTNINTLVSRNSNILLQFWPTCN